MASIATVVTMGFGTFGSVNLLPTIGYAIDGEVAEVMFAFDAHTAGNIEVSVHEQGNIVFEAHTTGHITENVHVV